MGIGAVGGSGVELHRKCVVTELHRGSGSVRLTASGVLAGVNRRTPLNVPMSDLKNSPSSLAPPLEAAVFRVVQEALVNSLRHARSDRIKVHLVQRDEQLAIEVSDRGVGFDPTHVSRNSFGLEGIRQRARLFNGHAEIDSRPGRGTRITVLLPLTPHVAP